MPEPTIFDDQTAQLEGYKQFVLAFEKLSPYALDHFTRLLFSFYQRTQAENDGALLKQSTFDRMLIGTMKEVHKTINEIELLQVKSRQSGSPE